MKLGIEEKQIATEFDTTKQRCGIKTENNYKN
jgi:hypothetical protein